MSTQTATGRRELKKGEFLTNTVVYLLLIFGGIIMAVPFLWMLSTSLKPDGEVFSYPPQWIPSTIAWENYKLIFTDAHMIRGFFNTMIVVVPTLVIGLFVCALSAYAFAKLRFPGRDKLFMTLVGTMVIPGAVMMIPAFIMFKTFGWTDSWKPLIIPGMFGAPMTIFFLRQFIKQLPDELEDAAKIDGMNPFGIFLKIIIPLTKPALITQGILSFNAGYNDYLGPLIYLNTPEKYTLQLELASFSSYYVTEWTLIMAGAVVALVPTLILFAFAQRFFIEGIALTGIKG
ncbi:carbohydrate ABC transporter permease [Paenibacillus sp. LHD-117]|uniref:carbohydrate ABC transporter permease n=1 Tax=Paenibacillus sp. LHD-117 TaxID=3071412 RepID=UPI0027DEE5C6|nr:carbohydrate ABC transporter permease [Paenibacillus sp. LHD-117]MDQ6419604.1 carbohydrate ABC transporter permease [Paenibacillus sp. LHD-117]